MHRILPEILKVARSYIGQEEIGNNEGWKDKKFQADMVRAGWQNGHSWCAYFVEKVTDEAYNNIKVFPWTRDFFNNYIFSAGAVATFNNAKKKGLTTDVPIPGYFMAWQRKGDWQGHIGIVESVDNGMLTTIEGNTNKSGIANGKYVMRLKRVKNGNIGSLQFLGYIKPFLAPENKEAVV